MPEMQKPGMVMTAAGLIGVFVSFVIQKGEIDPTALGLSIGSIFLATIGIGWMLGSPTETEQKKTSKIRHRPVKRSRKVLNEPKRRLSSKTNRIEM
ncbi:MAG TPA: hypothetical protein VE862_08655 [Candidatus Acidoferrum sp.]|nr:hypothetical protein [Candidatus Acidoferrum sp.]